jgi:Arc/MetJ family transcription regulator
MAFLMCTRWRRIQGLNKVIVDEDVLDAVAQTAGIGTKRLAIQQALSQYGEFK